MSSVHALTSIYLTYSFILFYLLRLGLPCGLFPSVSSPKPGVQLSLLPHAPRYRLSRHPPFLYLL